MKVFIFASQRFPFMSNSSTLAKYISFDPNQYQRGLGLEAIAHLDPGILAEQSPGHVDPYSGLVKQGICCDRGRMATWAVESMVLLTPNLTDIC